jgi:hypothetical protein
MDPRTCLKLSSPTRIAALLLLPVCLLGLGGTAPGATYVCGYVSGHWTTNGSPYIVTCDVLVGDLSIDPGVVVSASNYTFEVAGTLTATGTPAQPILFKAENPAVGWQGIFFNHSAPGSVLDCCAISGSVNGGVRMLSRTAEIRNCTLANNSGNGGIYAIIANGDLTVRDCILTNNSGSGSGGIQANFASGDLTVENCVLAGNSSTGGSGGAISAGLTAGNASIKACAATNNTARYYAGGIYLSTGTNLATLEDCFIGANVANPAQYAGSYFGGGIYAHGNVVLRNCVVRDNAAYARVAWWQDNFSALGGGLYAETGRSEVHNCLFVNNNALCFWTSGYSGAYGGALYVSSGSVLAYNSVLTSNVISAHNALGGAGLYVNSAVTGAMINCTVAYNNTEGVASAAAGAPAVMNSILYFNGAGGTQISGTPTVTYCDVQNGFPGKGNIDLNPIFVNTNNLILMLAPDSRCIDAGNPDPADYDVCLAPCGLSQGSVTNDMGAYGGHGACAWTSPCVPSIATPPQDQKGCLGHSATFTVKANGTGPLSYQWYFNTSTAVSNATNATLTLTDLQGTNAGKYSVVVSNPYGSVTSAMAQLTLYDPYTEIEVEWYFDAYIGAGLYIAGEPEATYVLKYTDDLRNTNWATWTPLATNRMDSSGWFFYLDEESPYSPMRFYQARRKP